MRRFQRIRDGDDDNRDDDNNGKSKSLATPDTKSLATPSGTLECIDIVILALMALVLGLLAGLTIAMVTTIGNQGGASPYHSVDLAAHKEAQRYPRVKPRSYMAQSVAQLTRGTLKTRQQPENERMRSVSNAFMHAWEGYRRYAWGCGELKPRAQKGEACGASADGMSSAMGFTLVEALGTAHIMGHTEVLADGAAWLSHHFEPQRFNGDVNTFETTIRLIGGLASAHSMLAAHEAGVGVDGGGGEAELFLRKAEALAEAMSPAFDTPTGANEL